MEPRKIIRLGSSSYAIALPKDWVDKSGLKKGDSVYILPNSNGELILAPRYQESNRNKIKRLDLSHLNKIVLVNELRAAYVQDNDILEIIGINQSNKELVRSVIREMMGFEIIEFSDEKIVMKDFFNIHEAKLENFLRKIDNSIRSMFEDMLSFMRSPFKERELVAMYETDSEINKFALFITRILFRGLENPTIQNALQIGSKNLFDYWWITFNLEHIADDLKRVAKILRNKDAKMQHTQAFADIVKKMSDNYINAFNGYYKQDGGLAKSSLKDADNLHQGFNRLSREANGTIREIVVRLSDINRSIYEISKTLVYALV